MVLRAAVMQLILNANHLLLAIYSVLGEFFVVENNKYRVKMKHNRIKNNYYL